MRLIKLAPKKEMSLGVWTLKRPAALEKLFVPVYTNAPFYQKPCVVPGQMVSCGVRIAEPRSSAGIAVFSPANGFVGAIEPTMTSAGEQVLAIEIQVDKKNPFSFLIPHETASWQDASAERLRVQIREAGVFFPGAAALPLVTWLEKGPFHHKTLIVNGCESEPYVTAGEVLLLSKPLEILKGADILRRAAGLSKIIIALSENAAESVEILKSKIFLYKWDHVEIKVFPARYPQDDPAALLPLIDSEYAKQEPKQLHARMLPDLGTVYAAYEAVALEKPFFERVVTVTGECIVQPQNIWAPLGLTVWDAARLCKGFLREPERWIAGGPMRGRAILSMREPISAATTALVALPKENAPPGVSAECIRCGECAPVCPSDLAPALIAMAAWREDFQAARELGAAQCIGCGNCSFVCPAQLNLAEAIGGCF